MSAVGNEESDSNEEIEPAAAPENEDQLNQANCEDIEYLDVSFDAQCSFDERCQPSEQPHHEQVDAIATHEIENLDASVEAQRPPSAANAALEINQHPNELVGVADAAGGPIKMEGQSESVQHKGEGYDSDDSDVVILCEYVETVYSEAESDWNWAHSSQKKLSFSLMNQM